MPYVNYNGLLVWEGERTEREELELLQRMNGVKYFPSANHRSRQKRESVEKSQQQQPPGEEHL